MSSRSHRVIRKTLCFWLVLVVIALCPKAVYAASKTRGAIAFSEMKVESSAKDRVILGRSVSVAFEGKLTNGTNRSITDDDLPHLTYGDDNGGIIELSVDEKELSPGKSCKVVGKGSIPVEGHDVPSATFSGPIAYTGLDGVEKDLAAQLSDIEEGFAAKDKKVVEDKKRREEKKAHSERDVEAFKSCVGKTAGEAVKLATAAGYEPTYYDSFGVDVTEILASAEVDSKIMQAHVSEVDINKKWLFLGSSAKVTLDYTEPQAAKERARKEILNCVGMSAGKVQKLVDKSDFDLVMYDSHKTDITKSIRKAKKGSAARKAKVSRVEIESVKGSDKELVKIEVEYTSDASRKKMAKEDGCPYSMTFSNGGVEVVDEHKADSTTSYVIMITGTMTNNDTWAIKTDNLPQLVVLEEGDEQPDYFALKVDETLEELGAGKSASFTTTIRVESRLVDASIKAPRGKPTLNSANLNGADALAKEIRDQLQRAVDNHDANVEYYREVERQNREQERRAQSCIVTETGKHYHSYEHCPGLNGSKTKRYTTIGWAEDNGLTACDRCH